MPEENQLLPLPTNTIIVYKGGGYDGCIWEWNYSYVCDEGIYHTIKCTGIFGCKTAQAMRMYNPRKPSDIESYNLDDNDEWVRFTEEIDAGHVYMVAKWLNKEFDMDLQISCYECADTFNPDNMVLGDYYGDGGIGVVYDSIYCHDCYAHREWLLEEEWRIYNEENDL